MKVVPIVPRTVACTHCDFGTGQRGIDRCGKCDGTGSCFLCVVDGEVLYFPNTREGYVKAMEKVGLMPEP